jgi:hypothetical protein
LSEPGSNLNVLAILHFVLNRYENFSNGRRNFFLFFLHHNVGEKVGLRGNLIGFLIPHPACGHLLPFCNGRRKIAAESNHVTLGASSGLS